MPDFVKQPGIYRKLLKGMDGGILKPLHLRLSGGKVLF
jgi:hypothetical protein